MSLSVNQEFWSIFDARRVKALDLKGPDAMVSSIVGWSKNRKRYLPRLARIAEHVEKLEPEIHILSSERFREEAQECSALARVGKLKDAALERGLALVREACWRALGKRPFPVQLMGVERIVVTGPLSVVFNELSGAFCQGLADTMPSSLAQFLAVQASSDPRARLRTGAYRLAKRLFLDPASMVRLPRSPAQLN